MAEWSNAAVLKTVDSQGSGGSNPSLSAFKAESQDLAFFVSSLFYKLTSFQNLCGKNKIIDLFVHLFSKISQRHFLS